MLPIIQVGPLAVQAPGLALLAGLWLGLSLAEKEAERLGRAAPGAGAGRLTGEAIYQLALVGLAAGLIGARLAYALRFPAAYRADPLGLLALTPVTLSRAEGLLAAGAAMALFGARRKLPLRPTLDALAPAAAMVGVALALAHLASGDAFGLPTTVPWRIHLWDDYRHPTQVYELLGALAALGVWWRQSRQAPGAPHAPGWGQRFLSVAALSAAARILVEGFRGDSLLLASGLREAQVWAWLILAGSLWGLARWRPARLEDEAPARAPAP
ncbi:MAG: prolipoprotein diacylglyceryl transferase [Anaerolineales bacterium]|nr:prolipoprotein diacylglyceryl transferase [Anaerolineales bacterium]